MKRILVTGSREWKDRREILNALIMHSGGEGTVLVHGACPTGADQIAHEIASLWPWTIERHPADWTRYGKQAGPIRNAEMVALGADTCIAFILPCSNLSCAEPKPHDSHGTAGCAALAEAAGIPVWRVRP